MTGHLQTEVSHPCEYGYKLDVPEVLEQILRYSRVGEHFSTNAAVDKASSGKYHDMRSSLKWGPFGRDNNREAIGPIPISRESFSVPVKRSELEDLTMADFLSKPPLVSNTLPVMPTLTLSRRGNEQIKLKTCRDVRAVKTRWSDLRTGENPRNGKRKVAGS